MIPCDHAPRRVVSPHLVVACNLKVKAYAYKLSHSHGKELLGLLVYDHANSELVTSSI